jgi:hypothetical protein
MLIIFKKKSDRTHLESIDAGTFTIKPGALSAQEISMDLPGAPIHTRLPGITSTEGIQESTTSIYDKPKLPGTTPATPGTTLQQNPQLPAAQVETESETIDESSEKASAELDKPIDIFKF